MNKPYSLMREKFVSTELRTPPEAVFQNAPRVSGGDSTKKVHTVFDDFLTTEECEDAIAETDVNQHSLTAEEITELSGPILCEKECEQAARLITRSQRSLDWQERTLELARSQLEKAPPIPTCSRCAELEKALVMAESALETLAKLGNGDCYGNSHGNTIAQEALTKIKEVKG
jgi:hypothetical protein